ncbi:hypothetical protein KIL84_014456 [Mauremys mutica]|uniref:Uncharacterized protein n=1 Tax=Mauremys mutica TaxID=74926 RepID=A0A9D4B814_9SAUR|nr:hypothetical protein KIL84_014456 [Mauremys mutica]
MDSSKTPDQSPKVIRTLPCLGPVYLVLTHTGLPGPKPSSASLSPLGRESHSQTLPPGAGSLDNVSLHASKLPWCLRVFPALVSYSQPFLPGATPLVSGSSLQELSHSLHSVSCRHTPFFFLQLPAALIGDLSDPCSGTVCLLSY